MASWEKHAQHGTYSHPTSNISYGLHVINRITQIYTPYGLHWTADIRVYVLPDCVRMYCTVCVCTVLLCAYVLSYTCRSTRRLLSLTVLRTSAARRWSGFCCSMELMLIPQSLGYGECYSSFPFSQHYRWSYPMTAFSVRLHGISGRYSAAAVCGKKQPLGDSQSSNWAGSWRKRYW
jgi:hypothetical protein